MMKNEIYTKFRKKNNIHFYAKVPKLYGDFTHNLLRFECNIIYFIIK